MTSRIGTHKPLQLLAFLSILAITGPAAYGQSDIATYQGADRNTYSTKLKKGDHAYYFTGEDPLGLEATGPCVGEDDARTMTVYEREKSGTPGMEALMAIGAITVLGLTLVTRRRREVER